MSSDTPILMLAIWSVGALLAVTLPAKLICGAMTVAWLVMAIIDRRK